MEKATLDNLLEKLFLGDTKKVFEFQSLTEVDKKVEYLYFLDPIENILNCDVTKESNKSEGTLYSLIW